MRLRAAALALLLVAAGGAASGAQASGYEFCNATSYILESAIAFRLDDEVKSKGWFRLDPGACRTVLPGRIRKAPYFVYARSIDAYPGAAKLFNGSTPLCVGAESFELAAQGECRAPGHDEVGFFQVDAEPGADWRTLFAEPEDFSLKEAEVAGAQRLLKLTSDPAIKVDGIEGENTDKAVQTFQEDAGQKPDGRLSPELFTALADRAEAQLASQGLDLCNRTGHLVWAALGLPTPDAAKPIVEESFGAAEPGEAAPVEVAAEPGDTPAPEAENPEAENPKPEEGPDRIVDAPEPVARWESSGWVRLAPDACAKVVRGPLRTEAYYYAEAVNGDDEAIVIDGVPQIWAGDEEFCVKSTRFLIRGRSNCAARGYVGRKFRRIEAPEEGYKVITLK